MAISQTNNAVPIIHVNDVDIYYEDSAPNDKQKPVKVFAHGLLWNTRMYDKQVIVVLRLIFGGQFNQIYDNGFF
ncbi:hypothetical protein [Psychrobacter arcticus]|uniref:hypothetical protein n=1 Tax=Psychrobacter arcticus TaxID=334543 RepID=UPI001D0CF168|nr:hypothetical protein [Psychrobacter arcticus]